MSNSHSSGSLLNTKVLVQIIIDYVHVAPDTEEYFISSNYDPEYVGPTLLEKRLPVITLLNHVVRGKYNEVDAMLERNPKLLLERDTVTDYSSRIHYLRTAYQLARGAVDIHVWEMRRHGRRRLVYGMSEMMEEQHFPKLSPSMKEVFEIIQEQYQGQFPEGWEKKEEKRVERDQAALHKVWNVLREVSDSDCQMTHELDDKIQNRTWDSKGNVQDEELYSIDQSLLKAPSEESFEKAFEALKVYLMSHTGIVDKTVNLNFLKAIYQFRNHMEPKTPMTDGLHWNYQLMHEAALLYHIDYTKVFDNENNMPKVLLCHQKIFGYLNRFFTACDAQVVAQGMVPLEDADGISYFNEGRLFHRSLEISPGYSLELMHGSNLSDRMRMFPKTLYIQQEGDNLYAIQMIADAKATPIKISLLPLDDDLLCVLDNFKRGCHFSLTQKQKNAIFDITSKQGYAPPCNYYPLSTASDSPRLGYNRVASPQNGRLMIRAGHQFNGLFRQKKSEKRPFSLVVLLSV